MNTRDNPSIRVYRLQAIHHGRLALTCLEQTGIVLAGERVDVDRVIAAKDYWDVPDPAEQSPDGWIHVLLPQVRAFLMRHRAHSVLFGTPADEDFAPDDPHELLLWDDVEIGEPFDISARTLESMGCKQWTEVVTYMRQRKHPVWWWGQPE